ncbi:protein kinase [Orobanche minor]
MALSSLLKSAKNKCIDIGGEKYQIKGCAGQGGFAQVFKDYLNSNPDDDVALKIQKPPFPENEVSMERRRTKTCVDDDCVDDDSRGGRT